MNFVKKRENIYPVAVYKNVIMLSEHNFVVECPYVQWINVATYLSYSIVFKLLKYIKKFSFYSVLCRTMHKAAPINARNQLPSFS